MIPEKHSCFLPAPAPRLTLKSFPGSILQPLLCPSSIPFCHCGQTEVNASAVTPQADLWLTPKSCCHSPRSGEEVKTGSSHIARGFTHLQYKAFITPLPMIRPPLKKERILFVTRSLPRVCQYQLTSFVMLFFLSQKPNYMDCLRDSALNEVLFFPLAHTAEPSHSTPHLSLSI